MAQVQSPVRSQFASLRWKLLLAFLGVIALALGAETFSIYRSVAGSLYDQLETELLTLAEAAAYALEDGRIDPSEADILAGGSAQSLALPGSSRRQRLGIEWFDPQGQRLYQVGRTVPDAPLEEHLEREWLGDSWTITLEVVGPEGGTAAPLQGFVRVAIDGKPTIQELRRLKLGIIEGSAVALVICGIGSWWLMRLVMTPIEQSFERLRQFTADASHELRSPLTAIQTSMDVMQSHPDRFHAADWAKIQLTASATQQMGRLVEDLLLLSRFDASTIRSTMAPLPIDELLEDLADLYSLRLGHQSLTLTTRLQGKGMVLGDAGQLKRLFTNLLDNAIKYTPAPGQISFSCQPQDRSIVVTVADTGIGIAADQLDRVYDRFWRAETARSHQQGSGLGLAIVRSIVEAHQGSIVISSQLHRGTQVRVTLPLIKGS